MLSKREIKLIRSLQLKKNREGEGLFVVEGAKNITEVIASDYEIELLAITEVYVHKYGAKLTNLSIEPIITSQQSLESAGTFKSNDAGVALVRIPKQSTEIKFSDYAIVLDQVQDPGNLGTIIRTADWFGIDTIICSQDTVDCYNSKVINSTMGSFTRVKIYYEDLLQYLPNYDLPVYGALLEGKSLYETQFNSKGLIMMGNESKGIRKEIQKYITHPVHIPRVGGAESLNVAMATGIICAFLRNS